MSRRRPAPYPAPRGRLSGRPAALLVLTLAAALFAALSAASPALSQDGPSPPAAPGELEVSTEGASLDVEVDWDDVDTATSYRVRWRPAGTGEKLNEGEEVEVSEAEISVEDFGTWVVRVQACNDAGCGKPSAQEFEVEPEPEAESTPEPEAESTPEPVSGNTRDLESAQAQAELTVSVRASSTAPFAGDEVTFRAVIGDAPDGESPSYQWELGYGGDFWLPAGSDATFAYLPHQPETASVRVTVTYPSGAAATSAPRSVTWRAFVPRPELPSNERTRTATDPVSVSIRYDEETAGLFQPARLVAVVSNLPADEKPRYRWEMNLGGAWHAVGTGREFPWSTFLPETARFRVTVFHGSGESVTSDELALAWAGGKARSIRQVTGAQTSTILIRNSGQTSISSRGLGRDWGQAFTTGSSSGGYKLTSVQISFAAAGSLSGYAVRILNDDGSGSPGTEVGTLNTLSAVTEGLNEFTGDVDLDAGTTYYVVFDMTTNSTVPWRTTDSDDEDTDGAAGWSIGDVGHHRSRDNSGTWAPEPSDRSMLIVVKGYAKSVDTTVPTLESAAVDGTSLRLNYNEALDTGSTPATTDFTVSVAGTDQTPTGVAVSGQTVTLTLGTAATAGQTVTVSYTVGTNPIQDVAGNDADALSSHSVTNVTGDMTVPTVSSATVDGTELVVTFSEALDTTSVPPTTEFTVSVAGTDKTPSDVEVSGSAVTLTLATADAVTAGQTVTVSYTAVGIRIQDLAGNLAAAFNSQSVTNNTSGSDMTPPTVSGAPSVTSAAGSDNTYAIGDTISVKVTFSENVTVTGTPQLEIAVGSNNRQANYASGSGTTALTFSYTVASGDADSDGIAVGANKLTLNSGTIKDAASNDATLTHTALAAQSSHKVDGVKPTVSGTPSVTSSSGTDNTYAIGDTISVKVTFSENVTVTGTPQLEIAVGSNNRQANYASGTGSTELTFSYTVASGDADSDGIAVGANKLTLNSGTIKDAASNDATLTHAALAAQSTHKVDGVAPTFDSATVNGTSLVITFSESMNTAATARPVSSVFRVTATPSGGAARNIDGSNTAVTVNGAAVTVTLSSAVVHGETVTVAYRGIALAAQKKVQDLAGNNLADFAGGAVTNNTPDTTPPTLSSATVDGTSLTLNYNEALDTASTPATTDFTVSVAGTDQTPSVVVVSGSAVTLTLGTAATPGQAVTVSYTKGTNPIQDVAGNDAAALSNQSVTNTTALVANINETPSTSTFTFNRDIAQAFTTGSNSAGYTLTSVGVVMRVTSVTEPNYSVFIHEDSADSPGEPAATSLGELTTTAALLLNFAIVQFDASGNGISLDASTKYWVVIDMAGVADMEYRATASDNEDSGGAAGWTIADTHLQRTVLSTTWVATNQNTVWLRVNGSVDLDTTVPTLSSATVDGTSLKLNYNEALDTTSTPATTDFTVSVAGTDQTPTGVAVAGETVTLTLGTAATQGQTVTVTYTKGTNPIQDLAGNDAANLSSQSVTNSTGDTTAPTVSGAPSVTSDPGSDSTYAIGDTISVKVTFNEVVTVTGTPQLEIAVGSNNRQANYASGSGSTELTFSYTVVAGDGDSDGIAVAANKLTLNSGTIKDAASNDATLTHVLLAAQSSHKVDGVKPTVSGTPSVTSSSGTDNTYAIGDTISVKVTFSENVTVTGTPQLEIAVGSNNRQANYASGTGSTELTFSYTVASGDADSDGIAVGANKLTLNSGTIKDAASNDATLTHAALAAQSTHKVDGVAPTFDSATVNGTSLVITFSESMNTAATARPVSSVFRVTATPSGGAARNIDGSNTAVTVNGAAVTVTLSSAVVHGETVTVAYRGNALGAGNKVRDLAGNNLADFSGETVTNTTPDMTVPTLDSATVSGSTLTLNYSEALDTGSTPATTDFTVSVAGTDQTPTGVVVSGSAVTLTLGTAATAGQTVTVTVTYTVPATNPIQDLAGNDAAALSSQAVTNNTPAPPPVSQPSFGGFPGGGGPSNPPPSTVDYEWTVDRDIEALDSGNDAPTGMWSDGTTVWLADNGQGAADEVYAYDLETGERVEAREFALAATNRAPRGFWSGGGIIWVSDSGRDRLFAYDRATGERLEEREIALAGRNKDARGIWGSGEAIWVLNANPSLYVYDPETGALLGEYTLHNANRDPRGMWSDGVTLWVSDHGAKRIFAYRLPALPEAELPEEPPALERVVAEEFERLSRASNNSPRGIWSDGEVMYVADANDGKVYTYNMPDAIDARLASLSLEGVDIGEFDPASWEYDGVPDEGVTETTVAAEAVRGGATFVIEPPDADEAVDGHQVALEDLDEITVTVISEDGSRTRIYRVALEATEQETEPEPWAHCLKGALAEGFSLLVYEGGTVDELAACAGSRSVHALYALSDGEYVPYFPEAPDFVNRPFADLFADGVPSLTPLIVASEGPPSADPAAVADVGLPWSECLRGPIAEGFSALVYEGGSVADIEACADARDITALYVLDDGDWVAYVLGAPDFVNRPFADLFPDGVPAITPLIVKSEAEPPATAAGTAGAN